MKSKFFWLAVVVLVVAFIASGNGGKPKLKTVAYSQYKPIGNMYDIVISPEANTSENMKLLAVQLEEAYKTVYTATVFVFDDANVAVNADLIRSGQLDGGSPQAAAYDKHLLAVYFKTPGARHDFSVMHGNHERIDFRTLDMERFTASLPHEEPTAGNGKARYVIVAALLVLLAVKFYLVRKERKWLYSPPLPEKDGESEY